MIIYRDGKEIHEIKDFKVVGKFMDVATLDCTIKSAVPISFEIGDYVVYDYNGLTYSLYDVPTPKKQARSGTYGEAFIYDLKFKSDMEQLSICPFLDMVANDNGAHYTTLPSFSTFENVYGIAARIQANMDYLYPNKWRIEVADTTDAELGENLAEAKEYSVSGQSCLEGLKKIYDTWGVGFIHSVKNGVNVISIGKSAGNTSLFRYGKGQGLRTVKKSLQNTDQFATRVYAYGSTRNIPARWYNDKGYIGEAQYAPNLMIPPSKWVGSKPQGAYIDAVFGGENRVEKYGLRIKTFSYDGSNGRDEIFPSVEKVTAGDIRAAKAEMGDKKYIPSSQYSNSERMDYILKGSKIEDDGTSVSAGYELYSNSITSTIEEKNGVFVIAEDKGDGTYRQLSLTEELPLCSFYITDLAEYKIGEIENAIIFDKNEFESVVNVEFFMKRPAGDYLKLSQVPYIHTGSAQVVIPLVETTFQAAVEGVYTLVARVTVGWSADYVNPLNPEEPVDLDYTIPAGSAMVYQGVQLLETEFTIKLKQIGFDLNSVTASDGSRKTITMRTGMCSGRSFIIKRCTYSTLDDSWELVCQRTNDSSMSLRFPNSVSPISAGDQFILLNINMPDLYVYTAMQRLYNTAVADLKYYSNPQFVVSPEVDNLQMARSPQVLKEGMYMPIEDTDIDINDDILIDGVTITENGKELRKFDVTLRNDKIYNRFSKIATSISALEKSIEEAKKNSVNSPVSSGEDAVILEGTSSNFFFWDEENEAVRTKHNLIVEKAFTFGGAKEGEGEEGGGSAGITTFDVFVGNNGPYPLQDGKVNLPAYPVVPNALPNPFKLTINGTPYDGSAPVDIEVKAGVDDAQLSEYAKKDWVEQQGYIKEIPSDVITETELSNKGYATEKWVNNQGFLTAHQSLTHLLSKDEAADTYQPKGDYAVLDDLNSYLLISTAKNTYATKTALNNAIQAHDELREEFDALNGLLTDDTSGYIDTWNEVKSFLDGYSESQDLATILSGMNKDIANRATIEALNGATARISTLETTLSTEQGYIDTLQGYFTSGKAKKAIADGNGNNIVDTYATKAALKDVADKVTTLQDMWFFDEAHANTIRTLYNVVVDKAISFGGYGESSGSGGGITTVTYDMVIQALGFTPYNSSNPKGYITSSALSGYATQSWVTENYQPKGDYLTSTTGVTLSTDQTITGIKTFSNGLKIGSTAIAEKTKNSTKYVEIDGNLVVTGAISFGGFGEGSSTGGGITSVTKDMVISALGYTPYNAANFTKANIKSTLGIYDWALAASKPTYTKSDVGLGNVQNTAVYTRNLGINGVNWTFASTYYTEDGTSTSIYTPTTAGTAGQYLVSNGAGAPYWYTISPYDSNKSRTANTVLAAPDGSAGSAIFRKLVSADIPNLDWSKITSGKPTTLSGYGITDAYTKATADSTFLKLIGGTLTGSGYYPLTLKSTGQNAVGLAFECNNSNIGFLIYTGGSTYQVTDNGWQNMYKLIHSGNISSQSVNYAASAGSAAKLTTSVTIWGQSFNGTKNISGSLSDVTTITATGNISTDGNLVTSSDVYGNYFLIKNRSSNPYYKLTDGSYSGYIQLLTDGSMALGSTSAYSLTVSSNGNTRVNGNLVATGSITFGSASDRRLKDNVQSLSYEQAISVVMGLNPVTFKWNTTATELGKLSGTSDGFIADEYEKLIPNSGRSIWANYRAIDYTRAIPYVTAVVQNHETRLEYVTAVAQNHETRLEAAERRINELENELKQYRRA